MAQHDYTIANQSFPNYRTDHNNSLSAIVSNNSGATEPTTTYAYQWWYDTTNDILKMRNADNDAWITMFTFNQSTDTYSLATDVELTITENLDLTGNATISGDLTVDTDTLYVDSSNNRVGIGTSSPSQNLEVSGGNPVIKITDTNNTTGQTGLVSNIQAEDSAGTQTWLIGREFGSTALKILNKEASSTIFETSGTEAMRIDSSGHAIIPNGVTLGTAVGTYSASNTLDDYEEGTWTPSFGFSSAGPTAGETTGTGFYTKVGNMVTVWGAVTSVNVTGASGDARIKDLPFTSKTSANLVGWMGSLGVSGSTTFNGYLNGDVQDGFSYIRPLENQSGGARDILNVANCVDGSTDVYFCVNYQIN